MSHGSPMKGSSVQIKMWNYVERTLWYLMQLHYQLDVEQTARFVEKLEPGYSISDNRVTERVWSKHLPG